MSAILEHPWSAAAEQMKPLLTTLTAQEQVALANWLYDRALDEDESPSGDPDMDRILRTRTEAVLNGTAKSRPGPEVMAELRERFK